MGVVDWDKILANVSTAVVQRAKAQLPDGSQAIINTLPINHSEVVIYPKTDDPLLNKDAFRTWQLIRLPAELGGDKNDVSAFRVYSVACLRERAGKRPSVLISDGAPNFHLAYNK